MFRAFVANFLDDARKLLHFQDDSYLAGTGGLNERSDACELPGRHQCRHVALKIGLAVRAVFARLDLGENTLGRDRVLAPNADLGDGLAVERLRHRAGRTRPRAQSSRAFREVVRPCQPPTRGRNRTSRIRQSGGRCQCGVNQRRRDPSHRAGALPSMTRVAASRIDTISLFYGGAS